MAPAKGKRPNSAPVELAPDDYDIDGRPKGHLSIKWRCYSLANGPQSCWVADYDDLPGYYGEGVTVSEALDRLWYDLGSRPHFRVQMPNLTAVKLERLIDQKHRADAAAAKSRVQGGNVVFGGGAGVDASAKEFRVGKLAVNAARKALNETITYPQGMNPDREHIMGVSAESLNASIAAANERSRLEIWVARATPWRMKHKLARGMFPAKGAESCAGPGFEKNES